MVFGFFKKNTLKTLENFYQNETQDLNNQHNRWMALAVNEKSYANSFLTKEVILYPIDHLSLNKKSTLKLIEIENGIIHQVFKDQKNIYSNEINDVLEIKKIKELFRFFIDSQIESEISFFTQTLNSGQTSLRQLEAEEQALEWIKLSFDLLNKAIIASLTDPEYLFQARLFIGINPQTNLHEIRLICFNLDITYILLSDTHLRVLIYNKKNYDEKAKLSPALSGDYAFRKKEIFDQLIGLLATVSKGIHL